MVEDVYRSSQAARWRSWISRRVALEHAGIFPMHSLIVTNTHGNHLVMHRSFEFTDEIVC